MATKLRVVVPGAWYYVLNRVTGGRPSSGPIPTVGVFSGA